MRLSWRVSFAARGIVALGLAVLAVGTVLAPASAVAAPRVQQNIAYSPGNAADRLDLYHPAAPGAHPVVIFVHGGGWQHGDKAAGRLLAARFTDAGYVFASLDYRLYPNGTVEDEATDVAQAAAFLLAHADAYGIDPRRFALVGHSSGGHLVALVATNPHFAQAAGLDLNRLAVVMPLDGVFDITADVGRSPNSRLRPVFGNDPAVWRQESPMALVPSMSVHPRFCVLHETTPRFVREADGFSAALRDHHLPMTEAEFPGLSHMGLLQAFKDPSSPVVHAALDCLTSAFAAK
ncbi:MAG TPA: alpha/beta hydrolase [Stellaceae bacterium]|nr:alpha/beta hydrolase [Stellaceae bacterium]